MCVEKMYGFFSSFLALFFGVFVVGIFFSLSIELIMFWACVRDTAVTSFRQVENRRIVNVFNILI